MPFTAPNGGIRRSSTSSLMALAQGRACSKVVSAKDEPPSRWQDAQRLSTIREISRDQVILVEKTSWALSEMPTPTIKTNETNFIFVGQVATCRRLKIGLFKIQE